MITSCGALANSLIKARLAAKVSQYGFIIDGYPRTLSQAEFFEDLATQEDIEPIAVGILVDDEVLVARLSRRRTCPHCGTIYNLGWNPPLTPGHCDKCGAALTQRKDDRPEVIRERLQVYHQTTRPLIDFYQQRGQYVAVVGEGEASQIFSSIVGILDGKKQNRTATL